MAPRHLSPGLGSSWPALTVSAPGSLSYMPVPGDLPSHTSSLTLKQRRTLACPSMATQVGTAGFSRAARCPHPSLTSISSRAGSTHPLGYDHVSDMLFQVTVSVCLSPSHIYASARANPSDWKAPLKFTPLMPTRPSRPQVAL